MSEYGLGDVVVGEVLPLRANPGDPDTLGPDFARSLHEIMEEPMVVLPPEQWTHRVGRSTFAEALQAASPDQVRTMAVDALVAPARRRRLLRRGKLDG